ncbi:MAG: hypothetical protein JW902_11020 [Syntrophaceae bacterium]|nr:hypothetical protein [Syntrophaceae bacterium]
MKDRTIPIIVLMMLFFWPFTGATEASVIARMSFDQVVKGAEMIVEGVVSSKETRLSPVSGRPFTYFVIEIIDVIKGDYPDSTIEIGYLGGQVGELTLTVSDMRMPEIGEKGVYFIETTDHPQVHPLIGWQQGHYRVIIHPKTGREMIVSDEDQQETPSRALLLHQGTALEDFKQSIRSILEEEK